MLYNYEQRNSDFIFAVRRAARRKLSLGLELKSLDLVREALYSPAPRWYLSTEYTWRRLKLLKAGKLPGADSSLRTAMLIELDGHLQRLCASHPEADPYGLLDDILSGHGPRPSRFFIGEEYALRLFTGSALRRRPTPLPRGAAGHRCRRPASLPPAVTN